VDGAARALRRVLMIVLDATIVNVALPTIQEDLGFSQNDLAWVVNAYLVAFGGLLLLSVLGCTADEALALLSLW
jgi:MFS family permease